MKATTIYTVLIFAFGFAMGWLVPQKRDKQPLGETVMQRVEVFRDTIRPPVPKSEIVKVVRQDKVKPQIKPVEDVIVPSMGYLTADTIVRLTPENDVIIPITRITYKTEDYKAVIEGYKPQLTSIEFYPETKVITNTIVKTRSPRWALTAGPGIGYTPKGVQPYVGATLGFVLWSR